MSERFNILIIMADQHSPHFLGCYGNKLARTPNLDRLAEEGMRFSNCYCPAPLCVPSRMSFMTCRTPTHNRVWANSHMLSSGIPTWAHVLGAAGYETSLIGRMHFVGSDQRHGFENRPLGEYCARHPGAPVSGGPRFVRYPSMTSGQRGAGFEFVGTGTTHYQYFDESVQRAAQRYLRERAESPQERPFAAVVGGLLPHCPFIAPKERFDHYFDEVDMPAVEAALPATIQRFREHRGIADGDLTDRQTRVTRAAYYALVEHMDAQIGETLDALEQTGLAENTIVIYTSDHGECAGEHGCWWKSNYYEASARVPMIVRLPGVVPAGTVTNAICNLMDIGPSIVEAGGGDRLPNWDGRSVWSFMQGNEPVGWRNETFSEFVDFRCAQEHTNLPSRMIRRDAWKLWVYGDSGNLPPALFNLERDPDELHDLGQDAAHKEIRDSLLEAIGQDWDRHEVSRAASDATTSHEILARWGAATMPVCEDTLPVPPFPGR